MMIGTLAIAGIPPLSGFFSKDEILFSTFLQQQGHLGRSPSSTALMTAFYMFRLMSMTFFGGYRGPAWETGGGHAAATAERQPRRSRPRRRRTASHAASGGGHGGTARGTGRTSRRRR